MLVSNLEIAVKASNHYIPVDKVRDNKTEGTREKAVNMHGQEIKIQIPIPICTLTNEIITNLLGCLPNNYIHYKI
jgi:hypothetical protein